MVTVTRLRAIGFLALQALVVDPLKRLRRRRARDHGRPRFLASYAPEGLVPISAPDREGLAAYMRCVGCGVCDLVCPLVGRLDPQVFRGPSPVALAYARATPDLVHVAPTLVHLPASCGTCRRCVEACPTRVPLHDLFGYANRKLREVEAARAPGVGL